MSEHKHTWAVEAWTCMECGEESIFAPPGYVSLRAEIADLTARLAAAEGERDRLAAALRAAEVKAQCYGNMVHGCSPALAKAGFPVNATQADGAVGGVARSVEALARALRAEEERAARLDLAWKEDTRKHRETVQDITAQAAREVSAAEERAASLTSERDSFASVLESREVALKDFAAKWNEALARAARAEGERDEARAARDFAAKECEKLAARAGELHREKTNAEAALSEAREQARRTGEERDSLSERVGALDYEMSDPGGLVNKLQTELDAAIVARDRWADQCNRASENYADATSRISKLTSHADEYWRRLVQHGYRRPDAVPPHRLPAPSPSPSPGAAPEFCTKCGAEGAEPHRGECLPPASPYVPVEAEPAPVVGVDWADGQCDAARGSLRCSLRQGHDTCGIHVARTPTGDVGWMAVELKPAASPQPEAEPGVSDWNSALTKAAQEVDLTSAALCSSTSLWSELRIYVAPALAALSDRLRRLRTLTPGGGR